MQDCQGALNPKLEIAVRPRSGMRILGIRAFGLNSGVAGDPVEW